MKTKTQNMRSKISLVSIHCAPSPQAVPLATAFLKSAAIKAPADIALLDFFSGQFPDECASSILKTRPDAVGFSMYCWNRNLCLEIAKRLRIHLPKIKIFAGGPEVTATPEKSLKSGIFDFIIVGEGEVPFTEFCQRFASAKDINDIAGLLTSQETACVTAVQPAASLDTIPSPFLSGILDTRDYSGILWQLSRGCGFRCDFCFDSRGESRVRRFPLERLEAELRHFAANEVSQIFVLDSTFNQDVKRAKTILRMIKKIAPGIHFHFEVRSEFIDREMAELFSKITCSLQIGLQSSNPAILKKVGRAFGRDDFKSRISLLNESGAVFGFDLMYGLPGDNLQGFYNSLDFAISLYPNHLDIFPLAVLPGTALQLRSEEIELRYHQDPPYTLISSPTFSVDEMCKAQQVAAACDIFYSRGKAVAWFNSVMDVIGQKPSEFFQSFGEMLANRSGGKFGEGDFSDVDVWKLQRDFLIQTFSTKKLKRFQNLVLDLAYYHYHYAAAILAPQNISSKRLKQGHNILDCTLRRSDSLQLARFHYEILELIEAGAPDIRWMAANIKPCGSNAAIYPLNHNISTQSFDDSYFTLLDSLDGHTCAGELAQKIGLTAEDATEFLLFALEEGIVILQK
jgi:radical SAM superfamily enzyme YgiQ (UPF0313 family)